MIAINFAIGGFDTCINDFKPRMYDMFYGNSLYESVQSEDKEQWIQVTTVKI